MKNKYHFLILLLLAFALHSHSVQAQQSLKSVHNQGVALYNQGKYAEALEKFQLVLKHQPRYVYARVYAGKCEAAMKNNTGPKQTVESTLAKVLIPNVDFQQVPLGDALTYIRQRSQELTGGKVTPNIIFSGSQEQRQSTTVTMKLNGVPVTTLLKYIGDQTRCQIRYDEHAIMVTPLDNLPKQTASAPEKPSNPFENVPAPNPFQ